MLHRVRMGWKDESDGRVDTVDSSSPYTVVVSHSLRRPMLHVSPSTLSIPALVASSRVSLLPHLLPDVLAFDEALGRDVRQYAHVETRE